MSMPGAEGSKEAAPKKNFVLRANAPPFDQPVRANSPPFNQQVLNANALPFQHTVLSANAPPFPRPVYSDNHCLFLTFSNGFPLTESQIFGFFNRMFASLVEDVYVHRPRPVGRVAKPSLFGKIMFKSPLIPDVVMGSREKVCLWVDGRPMYCRRFVNQKSRTANAEALRDGRE